MSGLTDRPKISVILPTYCPHPGVDEKLWNALANILTAKGVGSEDIELVIVEQGKPIYGRGTEVSGYHHTYVHLRNPVGFARAVNLGVHLSHGDFLFIINNDIVLPPSWDTLFLAEYTRIKDTFQDRIALLAPIDYGQATVNGVVYYDSWWSCVFIPRAAWNTIGPLDETDLPYRFHDQDWSIRANELGFHVLRSQSLHVAHDEGSTYRHMKPTINESKEEAVMLSRYGCPTYAEWIKTHPTPPLKTTPK